MPAPIYSTSSQRIHRSVAEAMAAEDLGPYEPCRLAPLDMPGHETIIDMIGAEIRANNVGWEGFDVWLDVVLEQVKYEAQTLVSSLGRAAEKHRGWVPDTRDLSNVPDDVVAAYRESLSLDDDHAKDAAGETKMEEEE